MENKLLFSTAFFIETEDCYNIETENCYMFVKVSKFLTEDNANKYIKFFWTA